MAKSEEKPSLTIRLTRVVITRPKPWLWLGVILSLTAGLGMFRLQVRTDGAALHPGHDPVILQNQEDRATYQETERVLLLMTATETGPLLTTQEGFLHLEAVHRKLAWVPGVDREGLRSLVNQLDIPEHPNLRCLPTFFDSVPTSEANFSVLLRRIREFAPTSGFFLSEDGRAAGFLVAMRPEWDRQAFVDSLQQWLDSQKETPYLLRLTGPVVAETTLGMMVLRDLTWLAPLMVATIAVLLLLALRTAAGVCLAMAEVGMTLAVTLGVMGFVGVPITLVTTILPVVLMTMAVTDEIHFLERFQSLYSTRAAMAGSGDLSLGERGRTILAALEEVGRPIVVTSLTTSLGFLSFLTATMAPIRHFGAFAAFGILVAMLLTFTLMPALLMVLPATWLKPISLRFAWFGTQTDWTHWLARRDKACFLAGILFVILAGPGWLRLNVQDAWMDHFDPQSALVSAERDYNAAFWGSYRFDVVLRAEPGFFHLPEGAAFTRQVSQLARQGPRVGGAVSYLTPYQRIALLQKKREPVHRLSAQDLAEVVNLARFAGPKLDLTQHLGKQADHARVQVFVNSPDYRVGKALKQHMTSGLAELDADVSFHFSGDLPVAVAVVKAIVSNQWRSVGWTLLGIGILAAILFRGVTPAGILMFPVLVAAGWVLAAMGWLGLPIGIASSMFMAMTIGAGVDFAIHFTHRYQQERKRGADHPHAVIQTLATTGKALRWNALALALGFLMLSWSALKPNHQLGWLLAAAMLAAYGATLLFMPFLLRHLENQALALRDANHKSKKIP